MVRKVGWLIILAHQSKQQGLGAQTAETDYLSAPAELVSAEASPLGTHKDASRCFLCGCISGVSSSYKDTSRLDQGPSLMASLTLVAS